MYRMAHGNMDEYVRMHKTAVVAVSLLIVSIYVFLPTHIYKQPYTHILFYYYNL